jgi:SAM-dependent methyltransferase
MSRWLNRGDVPRGEDYDARWQRLAATGANIHGEADLVTQLLGAPGRAGVAAPAVLDAGCGTGRVAIELLRRGYRVVGVDADPAMLQHAAAKAADAQWVLADLAALEVADPDGTGRLQVDLALAAGNVMIFLAEGTEAAVLGRIAGHVRPGGLLVAGFQLGGDQLSLAAYDAHARAAGFSLEQRYATWDRQPFTGGDYAVSVHRRG